MHHSIYLYSKLWLWGRWISYISTRSTLMPQGSVASSNTVWKWRYVRSTPVNDVWRGLDSSYSHIIHSIGSHNYNIIRQFKSQFINYTLDNTQRKAQLQHLISISLCQMDHVWYIHLKETVVAASECSIEELRGDLVRARSLPICWLPLSLSRQLRCSGYLGRPGPSRARQSAPGRHM